MNCEDVEELRNFEEQLKDITKKINIFEEDNDEVWKKSQSLVQTKQSPQDDLKVLLDATRCPPQPQSPAKDGRISPEGSSSSTHSLNKQETGLFQCKPLNLKSIQKSSYLGSSIEPNSANVKQNSKTSLVQNWERFKDLSCLNRPSVLQLTNHWNMQESGRVFPSQRSAHDAKRDPTTGRGNFGINPHSQTPRTVDDVHPTKDPKLLITNGYHSDQSGGGRRLPDVSLSKLQSCSSLFQGKPLSESSRPDPASGLHVKSFRERGSAMDRSFHVTGMSSKRSTDPAGATTGSKGTGKPIQMTRWVFTRAGRDPLHKTNSLDSNEGAGSASGAFSPGPLARATSLSKFDDDDEFLLSPPTTASASSASSHSVKPTSGTRFGYGAKDAAGSGSSSFVSTPEPSVPVSPVAPSAGLTALSSRSAYCFAHGGSTASTPSGGLGSTLAKSPINGPVSSPYATLRLQSGRTKASVMSRKEDRCMSPHLLTSAPISPSSRLAEDIQATEVSQVQNLSPLINQLLNFSLAPPTDCHFFRQHLHIRRLRQDLQWAKEQVALLTSRLSTNANVVQAFDQSLSNIANRLQQLSSTTSHKKSGELAELLSTVESLRRQNFGQPAPENAGICSILGSEICTRSSSLCDDATAVVGVARSQICRQASSDSITSSAASVFSSASQTTSPQAPLDPHHQQPASKKKTVKSWLRSSFGKAFSRKKPNGGQKTRPGSESASSITPVLHANSMPSIPYSGSNSQLSYAESTESELCHLHHYQQFPISSSSTSSYNQGGILGCSMYQRTPSSSSAMDGFLSASQGPYPLPIPTHKIEDSTSSTSRLQLSYNCPINANHKRSESLDHSNKLSSRPTSLDMLLKDRPYRDGQKITVCVEMTNKTDVTKPNNEKEISIGALNVGDRISWDLLDGLVRRVFQEHLIRLDPATSLGLTGESVYNYRVGEITRWKESKTPELLPIGYLVGDVRNIKINLRGNREGSVDLLAFETLIPKSILHRYLKLLLEHRRIILSGSTGTGKTYLAQRLAECLVTRSGAQKGPDAIAIFRVDSQSSKELRQSLTNMADQCEQGSDRLPVVVILDNLHHVSSLSDVFSAFLDTNYQNSPYIIGTMNQATCSSTDLQLHHNFRWVLYANHIEPVRSFLGRYLRRLLVANEVTSGGVNADLNKVVEWLPKVWQHVNKFLETHSSCDITIGPRLFLLCPMDVNQSQIWFTDLWNYSIVPYLLEAVREGIQTYGCRAPWEDLADWVIDSYPWSKATTKPALLRLRPEDVGYESKASTPVDKANKAEHSLDASDNADMETPLVDIMNRLQEAAKQSDSDDTTTEATDLSRTGSCKSEDSQCLLMSDDMSLGSYRTSII